MNIIVAVNSDWGIGFEGKQSVVLSEDRRFFRDKTIGGVIIAGRKTFEDFPGPLPKRKNILLTREKLKKIDGVTIVHSIQEVFDETENENPSKVFVVGGGEIYRQFLPYCTKAYVTKLEAESKSDTYFENLDELESWSLDENMRSGESDGVKYVIAVYTNNNTLETLERDDYNNA